LMGIVETIQELLAGSSLPVLSALLLGLLVSLSPCPLATNVAALAYLGKQATSPAGSVVSGMAYALGRALSYSVVAALLVFAGLEAGRLSWVLQDAGQYLLGPVLVVAGLVVLGVISLPVPAGVGHRLASRLAASGWIGALALGGLFALAFCPYSAALFFGVLIPLALASPGGMTLAPVFAVGTALPVLLGVLLLSAGVSSLARWASSTAGFEPLLRRVAGVTLVAVGIYSTWSGLTAGWQW
jgi:cytochrome c-type biogenesis protein